MTLVTHLCFKALYYSMLHALLSTQEKNYGIPRQLIVPAHH